VLHCRVVRRLAVSIHRHLRRLHLRCARERGLYLQQLSGLLMRQLVAGLKGLHLPGGTLRMLLQRGEQRDVARFLTLLQPQRFAHRAQIVTDGLLVTGDLAGNIRQAAGLVGID
jgi:hypothetical protein